MRARETPCAHWKKKTMNKGKTYENLKEKQIKQGHGWNRKMCRYSRKGCRFRVPAKNGKELQQRHRKPDDAWKCRIHGHRRCRWRGTMQEKTYKKVSHVTTASTPWIAYASCNHIYVHLASARATFNVLRWNVSSPCFSSHFTNTHTQRGGPQWPLCANQEFMNPIMWCVTSLHY